MDNKTIITTLRNNFISDDLTALIQFLKQSLCYHAMVAKQVMPPEVSVQVLATLFLIRLLANSPGKKK